MITRGNGDAVQGIFIRDTFGTLPFENVTITGNTVFGGMSNGITVAGATGLVIADNTVVGYADMTSNIRVQRVTDAHIEDNQATGYVYIDAAGAERDSNILTSAATLVRSGGGVKLLGALTNTPSALPQSVLAKLTFTQLGYYDPPLHGDTPPQTFAEQLVAGTSGADRLTATAVGDSRLEGGAGNDSLNGIGHGTHRMFGGTGDDVYVVKGAGDLVIENANEGTDTVSAYVDYKLPDNVETLRLAAPGITGEGNALDNRIVGSTGDEKLYGHDGNDLIQGGDGNDQIYGGTGVDDLRGENGNDTLSGDDGNDTLNGGAGNDILYGGAGNDILEGGPGSDTMSGGAGNDSFRFRGTDIGDGSVDRITDFVRGQDRVDLSAIDSKAATAANDAFSFIGSTAFHGVAGELRAQVVGGDTHIFGDVNGDKVADFTIVLQGVTVVAATDFIL